jgi:hypothetical protein
MEAKSQRRQINNNNTGTVGSVVFYTIHAKAV